MWEAFKLWFAGIRPELMVFLKAAVKLGIDALRLPLTPSCRPKAGVVQGPINSNMPVIMSR